MQPSDTLGTFASDFSKVATSNWSRNPILALGVSYLVLQAHQSPSRIASSPAGKANFELCLFHKSPRTVLGRS